MPLRRSLLLLTLISLGCGRATLRELPSCRYWPPSGAASPADSCRDFIQAQSKLKPDGYEAFVKCMETVQDADGAQACRRAWTGEPDAAPPAAPVLPTPPAPERYPVAVAEGLSGAPATRFRLYTAPIQSDLPVDGWALTRQSDDPAGLAPDLTLRDLRLLLANTSRGRLDVVFQAHATEPRSLVAYPVSLAPKGDGASDWSDPSSPPPEADPIRIAFPDETPMSAFAAAVVKAGAKPLALVLGPAPCRTPPEGLRCVRGDATRPTFYARTTPATVAEFAACEANGKCDPATRGSWAHAHRTCRLLGMRLPTVAEARAMALPSPSWSADWKAPPGKEGLCYGRLTCHASQERLLTDGKSVFATASLPKAAVWCAADRHVLGSTVSWSTSHPVVDEPLIPEPELAKVAAAIEHDPIEDKGICPEAAREKWPDHLKRGGRSDLECRDPQSYLTSNEPFRFSAYKEMRGLGGAYVGIASDQAYDFIAAMRARWAWTGDYDPNVYRVHRLLRAVVLASETPKAFVAAFGDKGRAGVKEALAGTYDAAETSQLLQFYDAYRKRLETGYVKELVPTAEPAFGWLADEGNYRYIRTMFQQGRIVAIKADLMGTKAFASVGNAARKLGVPIRMFYVSNAPTAWGGFVRKTYADVMSQMPYDEFSVVFTTYNGFAGAFGKRGFFHYYLIRAEEFARRIVGTNSSWSLAWDALRGSNEDVFTVDLPSRRPDAPEGEPQRVVELPGADPR